MWYANAYLDILLQKLNESDLVGEIIIIDNNWLSEEKANINHSKVIILSMPENIYVNQAWNIGVSLAKYDNICLSNDDLYWDVDCLPFVLENLEDKVIGMSTANYNKELPKGDFEIKKIDERVWGWGCCMFLKKHDWVDIPSDLKIACGDDWIIKHNNIYYIEGLNIEFENVSRTSIRNEFTLIQKKDIDMFETKYKYGIIPSENNVFFYWDGDISQKRFEILKNCIYSTAIFNPQRNIYLISNSISSSQLDNRVNVIKLTDSLLSDLPIDQSTIDKYRAIHPRDFSDLFRLILLYKFGGSYIDTDDICINKMSDKKNLICRSYDPHTSFYNNIKDEECVPGHVREIRGYDHINMFPRNDCWQNWEPKSSFIYDIITNEKFTSSQDIISIGATFSWQSITNDVCNKRINEHGETWNFGLTLLYLFEDFVSVSSFWDRCEHGGEMCDIWLKLPNLNLHNWGSYKCPQSIAYYFYKYVTSKYPYLSHMWLHSKDANDEWFEDIDLNKEYSISTWIYNFVKEEIKAI